MPAYVEDTIAALATPPGSGAIAIVRVSGRDALPIASRILRPPGASRGSVLLLESHRARLAIVWDPITGLEMDQALVLPMLAPGSFTGEDVVEIHCHGGQLVSNLVLRALLRSGARAARPGEFTERAFLNGRLDLCQAEAIADLIAASSEAGVIAARQQLAGRLSSEIEALRDGIIEARATAEAYLDFPEDDLPEGVEADLRCRIESIETSVSGLVATYERGKLARDGARVVLVGKPNVGKSSVMNGLLGRDRALVSPEPGTTRDYLEEPAAVGSLRVLLCDTAGLRAATTGVEAEGVARSRELLQAADLAVVLLDGSQPLDERDRVVLHETAQGRGRLVIRNKGDLPAAWHSLADGFAAPTKGPAPADDPILTTSARTGEGLRALSEAIRAALARRTGEPETERPTVLRARHHVALLRAGSFLHGALARLREGGGLDLVACDLQAAGTELEGLLGIVSSEEILDRIFRRFCVGK